MRLRKDLRLHPPCFEGARDEILTAEVLISSKDPKFLTEIDDAVNWAVAIPDQNQPKSQPQTNKHKDQHQIVYTQTRYITTETYMHSTTEKNP